MIAIEFLQVAKTYISRKAQVDALKSITFQIDQGEVFGFVGPNGAGKSTTIKILLNVISDYQGEARIFGQSAREAIARRQVGYVPETPALYEQLTPLDILRYGLALHSVQRDKPDAWCMQCLEQFSVAHVAKRRVRELSKGTVQRVALAHAMVVQPRLLILDEPLSGLDPVGRKDVVNILSDYRKQGGTIFLTSHVLHDVERLADRFGLIHLGELKTIQSPNQLVGEEELVTVRSMGSSVVPGMKAENAGRWFAELPRSQLWKILADLERAGHVLIEVKPSLTLESAFMRYLGLDAGNKP